MMCQMKKGSKLVLLVFMLLLVAMHAARVGKSLPPIDDHGIQSERIEKNPSKRLGYYKVGENPLKHKGADTMQVAGSSLPDCSHACGSCTPCRLVMVSFVCSSLEEAETCPMAYKCMCHNKSYPVP